MTEWLSDKNPCKLCNENYLCGECRRYSKGRRDAINKLAEYETAEEEGRLVVLPCDTVYFICDKGTKDAHVRTKSILDLLVYDINGIDKDGRYWSVKEEAEKALKEMEENHE